MMTDANSYGYGLLELEIWVLDIHKEEKIVKASKAFPEKKPISKTKCNPEGACVVLARVGEAWGAPWRAFSRLWPSVFTDADST